jgi:AraC-like DNA-binding protein/ligand-binding sensor protein
MVQACFNDGACYGQIVKPLGFENLARLPAIQLYETAFRKVTGMSLKVVPPVESGQRLSFGKFENAFCSLATRTPVGCDACLEAEKRAQRGAGKKLMPQRVSCFAGLSDVAVPVVVNGRHVATLMCGQVFRRPPTARAFRMIVKMLKSKQNADWEKKLCKAYFETLVVTPDRFQCMVHLLNVFAQYLADYASRHAISASANEPKPVSSAKQFVLSRVEETITLALVAQHVHVSRFHFCKLFKKATGMTLTEYIACVRVEKAKMLLANSSVRISEVAYASGFGSIPRFNDVFKRHAGKSPTEYRATLRLPLPA